MRENYVPAKFCRAMLNVTAPLKAFDVNALAVFCTYGFAIILKVCQTCVAHFKVKLTDAPKYSFPCHTQKLLFNLSQIITSVHVCVCDLSHLFYASLALSLWWTAVCDLSPPQEGDLECVLCGRSPCGRGKCSCAAASLWHANRAFLSAGRVVPMHTALRETGGLHHSSGKFWDQQITVLLPPLTCHHWAAQFSLSVSLRSVCLSLPFCDLHKLVLYLSVRFFFLALRLSQLSFYCRPMSK